MKKLYKTYIFWVGVLSVLGAICSFALPKNATNSNTDAGDREQEIEKVEMDDTEWKKKLTPEQYRILRKAGTERPFGEVYNTFKKQGAGKYVCAGCNTELFSSNEKFDSKCGWPSFYDPSKAKNVKTSVDYLLGYPRTEVLCAVCDGHLGHVFTGEGFDTPTDKRYCINGTVLKFVPDGTIETGKDSKKSPEKEK